MFSDVFRGLQSRVSRRCWITFSSYRQVPDWVEFRNQAIKDTITALYFTHCFTMTSYTICLKSQVKHNLKVSKSSLKKSPKHNEAPCIRRSYPSYPLENVISFKSAYHYLLILIILVNKIKRLYLITDMKKPFGIYF